MGSSLQLPGLLVESRTAADRVVEPGPFGGCGREAALTMLERLDGCHRITLGAEAKFSEATKPTTPPISSPICAR
ncbi:hypothetical protein [Novosphingobium sp. BK486]|uniref:hypothetical protein n=1 Tax=unclassified Novosphingobium TaxID=2644732 RepID=UPI00178D44B8|nr:hypothetical protein [Novosphingobium sp. BK256]MBB3376927.1 hypothetical protein [Novosphingobium sp. BK280]MBB3381287.1 hypothetical protein [Novosphingobium sp. BK258]MBB3422988.1 hypothetical protein [Novosphingobium sp. BK267]MBB3451680.1 hypothetical protein [Novosphingobium sp. BK352]MBB3480185.1 hypothetical protein [Novosphingobium sp. BK369]MBB3503511.1 hypothetical protein [Novosphingobium sp. BK336]MBB3539245.1 hypothetical protein [Novosphingobium sp. BK486]MBB3558652.1 hypo